MRYALFVSFSFNSIVSGIMFTACGCTDSNEYPQFVWYGSSRLLHDWLRYRLPHHHLLFLFSPITLSAVIFMLVCGCIILPFHPESLSSGISMFHCAAEIVFFWNSLTYCFRAYMIIRKTLRYSFGYLAIPKASFSINYASASVLHHPICYESVATECSSRAVPICYCSAP